MNEALDVVDSSENLPKSNNRAFSSDGSIMLLSLFDEADNGEITAIKANHVSSSQSDRSKRVTCRCIKSLNAHFVSLNAH